MAESRRGIGDRGDAARYAHTCRRIEVAVGVEPGLVGRLRRLGDVVADYRLAAQPALEIDPTGMLAGLDDDELVDWWSNGCALREVVFAAADAGDLAALDWMVQMAGFAHRGTAHEFGGLLASELAVVMERVLDARRGASAHEVVVAATFDGVHDRQGWRGMPVGRSSHAFGRFPV